MTNSILERFFNLRTADFLEIEALIAENRNNGINEITPEIEDLIEVKMK